MTTVDSLLEPGERVAVRTALHPVSLLGAVTFACCALLVTVLLIVNNELPARTEVQVVLGGVLVAASGFVRPLLRLRNTEFAVTDRRFLVRSGAFRMETLALPLSAVQLHADRPRRLADAATVAVSSDDGARSWGNVARAQALVAAARRPTGGRRERRQDS